MFQVIRLSTAGKFVCVAIERTDGRTCLRRQVRLVAVEDQAQIERQRGFARQTSDAYSPVVHRPFSDAVGDWNRRTSDGLAVSEDHQHVVRYLALAVLSAQVVVALVEELAAELEVVTARPSRP